MLVRCDKCGYENFPQHRFCGMCGAGLRIPQPAAAQSAAGQAVPPPKPAGAQPSAPKSVSGPSFLGLADEPAQHSDVSYLLEDEPSPRHAGRYVVLIIVVAAVAASAWHWRRDLRSWACGSGASSSAGSTEAPNSPASSPPPGTPVATTEVARAVSADQKPNAGTADQPATNQPQAPAAAAVPPVDVAPAPAPSPAAPPSAASASPQHATPSQQSAGSKPQENSGSAQSASNGGSAAAAAPAEASATKSPTPVTPPKPAVESVSPAAESDALEAQGEKYLYGNGVSQNCARAQRSLLAAAARSNAKAQSVLGTMYATGHCATRDLPAAYHWFARALHQDPSNTRYEEDLKVLWGQMTPEERQQVLQK